MLNIIGSFFRNKKLNIIYSLLFIAVLTIIAILQMITSYMNYTIHNVYGGNVLNRTYYIYNGEENDIKEMTKKFAFEKVEKIDDENYEVILKNHSDTNKFLNYLDKNNINGTLDGNAPKEEIKIIERNLFIYNIVKIFLIITVMIIFTFIIKGLLSNDLKMVANLKIVGFKSRKIFEILFIRNTLIIGFSTIINLLTITLIKYSYIFFKDSLLISFIKSIDIINICGLGILIIVALVIINLLMFMINLKKCNLIDIIND